MKRFLEVLLLMIIAFAVACGGSDQPAPADDSATGDIDSVLVADVADVVEVEIVELYPDDNLDPALVSSDVPVSSGALYKAFYAWNEQTVVLQGYPYVFYGDSITIEDELELVASPGEREILVTFTFDEPLNLRIPANELVTASGTIDYTWSGRIELLSGAIVQDAEVAESIEISPFTYDGSSPVPVQDFFELFNVWIGKEITVEGYYSSITTSVLDSGDVVRIDLRDPELNSKCAACEMSCAIPEDVSAAMAENRAGTQIRGTIEGESFNAVGLVECELVNR